ncbi:hypothetical protein HZC35_00895 [Candidatus Saganbacteria bacterium]|nr:hypothetical protein [Candidatus Saganbacteria bacterium]
MTSLRLVIDRPGLFRPQLKTLLKGLRIARNTPISPRSVREIGNSIFLQNLTDAQARDHLIEVDAELKPLFSATLRYLASARIRRRGSIKEVLAFCNEHQATGRVSDLIADEQARITYIMQLALHFPQYTGIVMGIPSPSIGK